MPSITKQSTIDKLAQAFCGNGRKQEQAMVDVGYTPAYANSYCGKMWENKALKAAIAKIDEKSQEKSVKTRNQRQQFWTTMMDDQKANNGDRLRASELLGKSEADFVTVGITQDATDANPLSESETLALAALNRQYKLRLSKEIA